MGRKVKVGLTETEIDIVCRDVRGIEDEVAWVIENDWQENRYLQFDGRIFPFTDVPDVAEWDHVLVDRYTPIYARPQSLCSDCEAGPCDLKKGKGRCGLEVDAFQARLNFRKLYRGSLSQIKNTRDTLNYIIKVHGREHPVTWGEARDESDASHIGMFTALEMRNVNDLDRAQSYVEDQGNKLFVASHNVCDLKEIESLSFHISSMLLVSMNVSELIKVNFFGAYNSPDHDISDMLDWPPTTTQVGLGGVEKGKPVITFTGDDSLIPYLIINQLKEKGLADKIEVTGIGAVAHDVARFYEPCRILTSPPRARKAIRSGISDVLVASSSCLNMDILSDAKRVETRVIWTDPSRNIGLPDRTDSFVDDIVKDLVAGAPGAWIRQQEKAAAVAVKTVQEVKRKGDYMLSEKAVKEEAKKCLADCDLCFSACPNCLLLSRAVRNVAKGGLKALAAVEKDCILCGKCEGICPENIRLTDLLVAAQAQRAPEEKAPMRAGRGMMTRNETCSWAFSMFWGNCPGLFHIIGCGNAKEEDIGWMAHNLTARNAVVFVTGCAVSDVAKHYNEQAEKYIFQEFGGEANLRNLMNHGSCTACSHGLDQAVKWARTGAAISHYGAFAETVDLFSQIVAMVLIIWGPMSERMHAVATAWARAGNPVIIGPASSLDMNRFLVGNKWDWQKWWHYDSWTRKKRIHEPGQKHMIVPVETKEEAITMAEMLYMKAVNMRDLRVTELESYLDYSQEFFGEWPDDWHLTARTAWEMPLRNKAKMLKTLQDKYGWEIDRLTAVKARHPDGRLLTMEEYVNEYSSMGGVYPTLISRLFGDPDIREYKTAYEIGVREKEKK
ncbi:MAG: hypothetical protein WC560_07805 [Syntrophales bacterium]